MEILSECYSPIEENSQSHEFEPVRVNTSLSQQFENTVSVLIFCRHVPPMWDKNGFVVGWSMHSVRSCASKRPRRHRFYRHYLRCLHQTSESQVSKSFWRFPDHWGPSKALALVFLNLYRKSESPISRAQRVRVNAWKTFNQLISMLSARFILSVAANEMRSGDNFWQIIERTFTTHFHRSLQRLSYSPLLYSLFLCSLD